MEGGRKCRNCPEELEVRAQVLLFAFCSHKSVFFISVGVGRVLVWGCGVGGREEVVVGERGREGRRAADARATGLVRNTGSFTSRAGEREGGEEEW